MERRYSEIDATWKVYETEYKYAVRSYGAEGSRTPAHTVANGVPDPTPDCPAM